MATKKTRQKKASSETKAPVIENPVLVVRTCDKDLKGYGGFQWPTSGPVTAPEEWDPSWGIKPHDWIGGFNPNITCGGGLHAIEGIDDNFGYLDFGIEAKALIVETDGSKLCRVDGKVKFQFGIVKSVTTLAAALCQVVASSLKIDKLVESIFTEAKKDNDISPANIANSASGDDSQLAASGDDSQLAASGAYSQLAASGAYSKLAASGDDSKLAASGAYSQLAASGACSQLAASGAYSQLAASGDDSVVMSAGLYSIAKAGKGGVIVLTYKENERYRVVVGYVGEEGIEADTWYVVKKGKLVKA